MQYIDLNNTHDGKTEPTTFFIIEKNNDNKFRQHSLFCLDNLHAG